MKSHSNLGTALVPPPGGGRLLRHELRRASQAHQRVEARRNSFWAQLAGVLHTLEVDPRDSGTWYVGFEAENVRISGVYRTTNAGRNWELLIRMEHISKNAVNRIFIYNNFSFEIRTI